MSPFLSVRNQYYNILSASFKYGPSHRILDWMKTYTMTPKLQHALLCQKNKTEFQKCSIKTYISMQLELECTTFGRRWGLCNTPDNEVSRFNL